MQSTGRKRRFLGYGALNVLVTNLVLQGLLLVAGTGLATLLSQSVNVALGFVLYGKKVFRVDRLHSRSAFSYLAMALLLWCCNWAGITWLDHFGFQKNLSAILLIPALALVSYLLQKHFVFKVVTLSVPIKTSP